MSAHAQFKIETGIPVFLADPQSPWQRGTNENTNGLLRQYFPKGTALSCWSAQEFEAVAHALNTKVPERPWAGRHPPKRSTNTYSWFTKPVLHRLVEPGQYTSFAFADRLTEAVIDSSIGSVGDAYDNALAESQIGSTIQS